MEVSQVLGCPLLSAVQGVALAAGMWRERQFLLKFPAPPPSPERGNLSMLSHCNSLPSQKRNSTFKENVSETN